MARRRGGGEGTIIKRVKCPECGKMVSSAKAADLKVCRTCGAELPAVGIWMGALITGYDAETGKPKRQTFYGKTRAEVSEKLRLTRTQVATGQVSEPSKMRLAEWLDSWLNDYMKSNLRQTTWESYEVQIRRHLKPALGHLRLREIQTAHLQQLYNTKLSGGRADGKPGGLSARSVRYIHEVLRGALEQAKKEGKLLVNPADAVTLPTMKKKDISFLTVDQVGTFLAAAKGSDLFAAFLLELATGLRRGELLALRWEDVDLDACTVTVRKNLVATKIGLVVQEPKTDLAKRTISIPAEVVRELRGHRKRQRWQQRRQAGEAWEDNDLVFCNALGKPFDPRNFVRHYDSILRKADLPKISFHALRHTFATISLQEGVDIRTTQENLGHYDPAFTLRTYSGVTDKMRRHATDKIGKVLNGALKDG